jgi:hypothetical protein
MSNLPLDHAHDLSGRETHRLTSLFPAPDFVKSANTERLNGTAELPRHMYADPHNKLYPCHTGPATWMSALFLADKQANYNERQAAEIRDRIHKAAAFFGIAGLVRDVEAKVASANSGDLSALPDDAFAIVWTDEAGNKDRHFPLRNAAEIKYAAHYFRKYRDEFAFVDRHTIANKILTKAAEFEADTSDAEGTLELAAGMGACAAKVAAEMLRQRAQLVRRTHGPIADELCKLASAVEANPEEGRSESTRLKLAAVVDQVDRDTHLVRLYDAGGLARPEEVLFAINEKVAHDFMAAHVETTTGNVYNLDDLEKFAVDEVRNWLGDEFADAVSAGGVYIDRDKLAAIVPTLDRGMASTLDRLATEKGVAPAVKSAAADSLLPLDRLYELARS